MHKLLETDSLSKSKEFCECSNDKFIEKYGDDFLDENKEFEFKNDDEIFVECRKLITEN